MVVIIDQTQWNLEEKYYPSHGRIVRQIMEIFTNEGQITIQRSNNILDLTIDAINSSNRDIPYIEDDFGNLLLILDPFNSFPLAPMEKKHFPVTLSDDEIKSLRYVKLEIKYISMDPNIKSHRFLKTTSYINTLLPKKTSSFTINGMIQPDISITMPLGWRMGGGRLISRLLPGENNREGHLFGMKYFIVKTNYTGYSAPKISLSQTSNIVDEKEIEFHKPYITLNNGKRIYHYLIKDKDYQKIKSLPQETTIVFKCSYISQLSTVVSLISVIPFIFFVPISVVIIGKVIMDIFNWDLPSIIGSIQVVQDIVRKVSIMSMKPEYALTIAILTFSFFGVEYSMIREGFNIPYKYYHYIVFYIVIISIFLIFYTCVDVIPLSSNATSMLMI